MINVDDMLTWADRFEFDFIHMPYISLIFTFGYMPLSIFGTLWVQWLSVHNYQDA